ncbi:MAG: HU family DNA-binding protein [Paracoccaceae bacterium]
MVVAKKKTAVSKSVAAKKITPEIAGGEAANPETAKVAPVRVVRRKELVERIATRSGVKPNLIKSVLDAVLLEIGDVLSGGEALQVQPLGKLSVNRRKELPDGEVLICKLRRKSAAMVPPAEAAE